MHTHCFLLVTGPSQNFKDILFWKVVGTRLNHLYCAYGEWYCACILIDEYFFTWCAAGCRICRPNGVRPFQSGTAFVGEDKDGTWFVLSALHCFLDEESREITLQRKEPDDLRKTIDKSGGKLLQDRICKYEYWFCYRKQSKHVELRGDMLVANGAVRVRYNVVCTKW